MSPSIEQLEAIIKRPLRKGDILRDGGRSYEVLEPQVPAGEGHIGLSGHVFDVPTVKVRELTAQGPGTTETHIPLNDQVTWTDVVKRENRTDLLWWRKLFRRISS